MSWLTRKAQPIPDESGPGTDKEESEDFALIDMAKRRGDLIYRTLVETKT